MEGTMQGVFGLIMVLVALIVFFPITNQLLPTIVGDMGAGVGIMIQSIAVIIVACALFVFVKQSTSNNEGNFGR
jgi:hypothetical protein